MATIEKVGGTAFVVAEFRAEENSETAPLYRDPVVGLFLNDDTRLAAGRVAASFAPVKDLVKIRTRYLDDMLDQQLLSGCRQVVILGAGLDTRPVRKPAAGVTYFEIDEAPTLRLKAACYEQHGLAAEVTFIPGNYVTDGLIDSLTRHGFDLDLPTYFIWEGNTMYLPLACNTRILTEIRDCVAQFRVSFDYMAEAVIANTTGDSGITKMVASFAEMGAPWLSGIADIQSFARELDLEVIENFRTAELIQAYRPERPATSNIFDFYSVCTVGRR